MLSFHRQISIGLKLKKPLSNGRQGLSFSLTAGFSAPVEVLTGMSVSLPLVDMWLEEEKENLVNQEFFSPHSDEFLVALELLRSLQNNLVIKSSRESVQLVKLEADFYDFKISWSPTSGFMKTETLQVEVLNSLGSYGRCEIARTTKAESKIQPIPQARFSSLTELLEVLKALKNENISYSVHDMARSERWRV